MTNNVVRTVLTTTPVACCGLGALPHVGSYRLIGRVYAAPTASSVASDFKVRLSWLEGSGPLRSNPWVSPVVVNGFSEIDLGIINVPPKTLGTQKWSGQIEAFSATAGDTLDIDYILLFPCGEGYGKGRATTSLSTPTSFIGRDEFDQVAGALGGQLAPVGGAWATSGAATDFTVDAGTHVITRTTTGDAVPGRFAISGASALTGQLAQVDFKSSASPLGSTVHGVAARYIDDNNFLRGYLTLTGTTANVVIVKRVAGTFTALALVQGFPFAVDTWYTLQLAVDAAGSCFLWVFPKTAPVLAPIAIASDSALATGGALASGKPGITDSNGVTANTRTYDNFIAAPFSGDAVVFSGRSAEINSQTAERFDSTGTYSGPIQTYRGAHFFLQPAGDENRTNEVLVEARRNDTDVAQDNQIADSTTVTVHYTPRYSAVPR